MDAQLKAQCTSTIYQAHLYSRDGHGDATWRSPPRKVKARVETLNKVKSSSGDGGGMVTEETNTRIITEQEVFIEDRIWLPDANQLDPNEADTPKRINMYRTELGDVDYYEVFI